MKTIAAILALVTILGGSVYFMNDGEKAPELEPSPAIETIDNQPIEEEALMEFDSLAAHNEHQVLIEKPEVFPALETTADGYIKINWQMLSFVNFEEKYTEEVGAYVPYPIFAPEVQGLDGKKVEIKGYVIPVEELQDQSIIVLSAYPFSQCFFCGNAGPESVMDIQLENPQKYRFKKDDYTTFRGTLKLNDHDLNFLNYILNNAEVVEE